MIENSKVRFDRRKHFDGMGSSDPWKGDISNSLVVGEVSNKLCIYLCLLFYLICHFKTKEREESRRSSYE